jgi:magnesium chelatase family protein
VVPKDGLAGTVFLGELGLDGRIRPIPGILPSIAAAAGAGFGRADPPGLGVQVLDSGAGLAVPIPAGADASPSGDLADVVGQPVARRAAEICAAGGHHMLPLGAPGAGNPIPGLKDY